MYVLVLFPLSLQTDCHDQLYCCPFSGNTWVAHWFPQPRWIWRGVAVLDDLDGQPLRDFEAPLATISREEHGCFPEVMLREDPRISWDDISIRMPVKHYDTGMRPKLAVSHVKGSMRRFRFRERAACIAWKERHGSDDLQAQVQAELPRECLEENSTQVVRPPLSSRLLTGDAESVSSPVILPQPRSLR